MLPWARLTILFRTFLGSALYSGSMKSSRLILPALLGFLLLTVSPLMAAGEPDWPKVEQHAVDLLQRYVRIRSINPPADTRETAQLLQAEFAAAGLDAKLYQSDATGKTNLIVRLPGKDSQRRPLLLLNHMDVVPVDPKRWDADPFGAEVKDGWMSGRGTLDMKSAGIIQLTALLLLKQLNIRPAADIVFLATCDEESDGAYGAAWMIANHWPELNPEYVLDEGGFGSHDLFAAGKTVFGISVADKQVFWLRMRAQGLSGHASQPIPDNANDILLQAILKAKDFPAPSKPNAVVEQMRSLVGTFASNKFVNAIQQNTISLTTLRSGVGDPPKVNVIPSIAEATLDCRLLPGQNAEEFLSEIKARVNDPRVTFETLSHPVDPGPSRTDTKLYKSIERAIRIAHPEAAVMPIIVPYGTDTQKFRKRAVIGYGLTPMIISASTLATMHSDKEHIQVDQFIAGLHIYFEILRSDW
jgi:acetylornithine deacetylase/succinyl-diaminopimelate desuccinylase-like protein